MNKVDCFLFMNKEFRNDLVNETFWKQVGYIQTMEISYDKAKTIELLNDVCLIDTLKCPEFIFIDIDTKEAEDFYVILTELNNSISRKIQVVFLLDASNTGGIQQIKGLGLEYLLKPIDVLQLQNIFERYFFLRNPII